MGGFRFLTNAARDKNARQVINEALITKTVDRQIQRRRRPTTSQEFFRRLGHWF